MPERGNEDETNVTERVSDWKYIPAVKSNIISRQILFLKPGLLECALELLKSVVQ